MESAELGSEAPNTMMWLSRRKQMVGSSRSSGSLQREILVKRDGRLARKPNWCTMNSRGKSGFVVSGRQIASTAEGPGNQFDWGLHNAKICPEVVALITKT